MASSEKLRRVAFVRTDVTEERSASIIKVTRMSEIGTTTFIVTAIKNVRCESRFRFFILRSPVAQPPVLFGIPNPHYKQAEICTMI
jgi:hypothetical protein